MNKLVDKYPVVAPSHETGERQPKTPEGGGESSGK